MLVYTIAWNSTPWLIWHASESIPIGLYRVHPIRKRMVNDLVIAIPPEPIAALLAEAGYLPRGVPLLKRVVAVSNQTVCRSGHKIIIDGREAGQALERDSRGLSLPVWEGCCRSKSMTCSS